MKRFLAQIAVISFFLSCQSRSEDNNLSRRLTPPVRSEITLETTIQNPILPGFNPDPSLIRVGDDYYIVTSTFEWFPGLPVYHSKDLVNWQQIGHVLTRKSQLNLRGVEDSKGIYAPAMKYHDGKFYVLYTVVTQSASWPLNGYPNYMVTAENIDGPWSEPYLVNRLGFDPSLFVDDDGQGYIVYRGFDHRTGRVASPGIYIHEFDLDKMESRGIPKLIATGQWLGGIEGPHLYKRNGYYYLLAAEGGTWYKHAQTIARSKDIFGPYQEDPNKPLLTSFYDSTHVFQKAGHGSLIETQNGEWYLSHHVGRPLSILGNCPLGRETALQKVKWTDDDWLTLWDGGVAPEVQVPGPGLPLEPFPEPEATDHFEEKQFKVRYQFLREPADESWISLTKKPGHLSMRGRQPFSNRFDQSMIAQRITSFNAVAETSFEFDPVNFRQSAGLTAYYHTNSFYYFYLTHNEAQGKVLDLILMDKNEGYQELLQEKIPVGDASEIFMRLRITDNEMQYFYSTDGKEWQKAGPVLDFGKISDDYSRGYTGSMVGLWVQDLLYSDKWAKFDYFKYEDL